MVEDLWCDQAVGILGGEPKCCKSFLALDLAVSVASGALCLRRFRPVRTGPVLLFPAEDALGVVHHARKDAGGTRPGQALRGSSELHGWGDSNLYLRRQKDRLTLTTEHRAAPSADPFAVQLTQDGPSLALEILGGPSNPPSSGPLTPAHRVREALASLDRPVPMQQLRKLCSMRTTTLCDTLDDLVRQGLVLRVPGGYQLKLPLH